MITLKDLLNDLQLVRHSIQRVRGASLNTHKAPTKIPYQTWLEAEEHVTTALRMLSQGDSNNYKGL